ncbi:MAG: phosphoenolpyruvate--protein phosphotransferase [Lachnospiraceae bacterium]|jgi:phosphotransferase system enzyme I (PtsI)|nr:phosphoenolpyruvate--protein phosphotransferase [Lachnospiraceae bacterium]
MITLSGKKVSEGIAIGKILFYQRESKQMRRIAVKDVEREIGRFTQARNRAVLELDELQDDAAKTVGEANAMIFEMQKTILKDPEFLDKVSAIILEEKLNAEYALSSVTDSFTNILVKKEQGLGRGHEADVLDVVNRVLRILSRSRKEQLFSEEPFILAAKELYPSEAVQLDKSQVLGFVTMYGTINSHTAVLARTKGIPSIIGLGDAMKQEYEGKLCILDGFTGKVFIEPDYTTLTRMKNKQGENLKDAKNLEQLKGKENITQSGYRINVAATLGKKEDIERVMQSDAGGIGLFRTEFLYEENGGKHPTEEQQYQAYRLAVEAMGTKRVVIRTSDFGGTKISDVPDFGHEDNPALGYRGIRVSLDKEELFKPQLRAILRASAYGNVAVLFPMIDSIEEIKAAKAVLETVKKELVSEKVGIDKYIRVGIMIETPAAVMLSGELAREVDFFVIGTSDLTQLTMGADRNNEKVRKYYDGKSPAVLKMIRIVVNNAHLEGKNVSVCGDWAGDFELTEFFIQIGVDELAVEPSKVLGLRKKIREIR